MEDENRKEENQGASTSKKENKERRDADDEMRGRRGREEEDYEDRDHDDRSYTETSGSEYSARSRVDIRKDGRPEQPKVPLGKRDEKLPERRKKVRRGRVAKRRRSTTRRYQPVRRAPRRRGRMEKRGRDASVSTIFTRMSSHSGSDSRSCTYCGHRCCGRRSECSSENSRILRRTFVRKIARELRRLREQEAKQAKRLLNFKPTRGRARMPRRGPIIEETLAVSGLEAIQTGSKSKMLSPLFVNTNDTITDETPFTGPLDSTHVEITPEMIYETLRKLAMWKHVVTQEAILEGIKNTYPVNQNKEELILELQEKLRIATICGITTEVTRDGVKLWCLSCELQERGLTKTHVTIFWKVYADTMSPVKKNPSVQVEPPPAEGVKKRMKKKKIVKRKEMTPPDLLHKPGCSFSFV